VAGIEPGSLLSSAPVRPGDKLMSVGGKPCGNLTSQEIATLIRRRSSSSSSSSSYLNLVFHNESEDANPYLIESMLTKPTPEESLGVKLATSWQGGGGGEVCITDIVPHGLAEKSLLNIGDTLLRVNEYSCDTLTTQDVVDVLRNAPRQVCILARPGKNSAVVVAEVSSRNRDRNIPMATANPPPSSTRGRRRRRIDVLALIPVGLILLVAGLGFSISQHKHPSYNNHDDDYASYTEDYWRDPCVTVRGYNESSLFPYTNPMYYAAEAVPPLDDEDFFLFGDGDNDDDDANNTRNITTLRFQFIGHFNVFPLDVSQSPTDEQVNRLLEETAAFFAEILEEDDHRSRFDALRGRNSTTASSFWSLRMVFDRWEHHWCSYNYESNVQVFTTLEAGLTNVPVDRDEWILREEIMQVLQSSIYSGNDYIGTILWNIPRSNIFHHTYFVRWDDTSLWWT